MRGKVLKQISDIISHFWSSSGQAFACLWSWHCVSPGPQNNGWGRIWIVLDILLQAETIYSYADLSSLVHFPDEILIPKDKIHKTK